MNRKLIVLATVGVIGGLVLSTVPASAQSFEGWFSYSVKFVCGRQDPGGESFVGGRYRTVVNIHNPNYLRDPQTEAPRDVIFFKKAVLALPQGNDLIKPTCKQRESLPSDHALAVTCRNILQLFALSGITVGRPFEGYVVIELPPQGFDFFFDTGPLDVSAVYTASRTTADQGTETVHVEQGIFRPVQGTPSEDPCTPPG